MTRSRLLILSAFCLSATSSAIAQPATAPTSAHAAASGTKFITDARNPSIEIVRPPEEHERLRYRRSLPEARPALRGFRAPILADADRTWPANPPGQQSPPEVRRAADLVAQRLASDGLLLTVAEALESLGRPHMGLGEAEEMNLLRQIGLPVDLLRYFPVPEGPSGEGFGVVRYIERLLASGRSAVELRDELAAVLLRFTPSHPNFRVATECGDEDIALVRLQMTRGTYWVGIGDGGNLDVARQLAEALPNANFIVSIEGPCLDSFLSFARYWPLRRPRQMTIIPEPLTVAQWAQDDGKGGTIVGPNPQNRRPATLVPRYASRGEDGSTFVPGESFLADGLAAAGLSVIQSPLLFQGGNLLAIREPGRNGRRVLLIGEAEIYRNTALGLSRAQVLDAFRVEFGVDECVVLPAVSYHIDYELSVRTTPTGVVAFVNDTPSAARLVAACGIDAMKSESLLDEAGAKAAHGFLNEGRIGELLVLVDQALAAHFAGQGQVPESLTRSFSTSLVDSGVGNMQRFLLALDLLRSELPPSPATGGDPLAAYLRAIRRRETDRANLRKVLEARAWKIIPIPSLSEADRSITYLNGIQARDRYLMPAYGGFYAPLDRAAAAAFARALGPNIAVVPILSAESQRRNGAVHCSACIYPVTVSGIPSP